MNGIDKVFGAGVGRYQNPCLAMNYVFQQSAFGHVGDWGMDFVVRTSGDPAQVVPALRAEVSEADPTLAVFAVADHPDDERAPWVGVVGVVGDVEATLGGGASPIVYTPFEQSAFGHFGSRGSLPGRSSMTASMRWMFSSGSRIGISLSNEIPFRCFHCR